MQKKFKYSLIVFATLLAAFIIVACKPSFREYTLSNPAKSYILPAVLNEISGITPLNEHEVACVQDESGTVYIYDLHSSSITKEYQTGLVGDYEGIALVGNTIYMLRSDGVLVEYPDFRSPGLTIKEYALNLPSSNNEGLCYDMKNYRLLIAAKVKPGKDKENKEVRNIYSFDLRTKIPSNEPIMKVNVRDVEEFAIETGLPVRTQKNKKNGEKLPAFNFRPSEIAVNPFDRNIYLLSASDKLLLIVDSKGKMKHLLPLDPVLFNKAEGLAFMTDGTMLISNEAQKGQPTLLSFKYHD